jgi:hypothetical protein
MLIKAQSLRGKDETLEVCQQIGYRAASSLEDDFSLDLLNIWQKVFKYHVIFGNIVQNGLF